MSKSLSSKMSSSQFLKLQKEWYQKAKDSGFIDIEGTSSGNNGLLKPALASNGRKYTESHIESNRTYYNLAGKFFWDKDWTDLVDKRVWELHANGVPYRDIIVELAPVKKLGLEQVSKIIKRLRLELVEYGKKELKELEEEQASLGVNFGDK